MVPKVKRDMDEIQEEPGLVKSPNGNGPKDQTSLDNASVQKEVLDDEDKRHSNFMDFIRGIPHNSGFKKLGPSPSVRFHEYACKRDEFSRTICSEEHRPDHFYVRFIRKIDWAVLWSRSKEWIKDPQNLALFVWILGVAVSGAILFLVMTGMLDAAIPRKSQRDTWFEVNNQILNALFTLMCLYQHPKRCYYLVLLFRWETNDIIYLRKIYCKGGTYKPHEWKHMMVVVLLLQLNCFAQYALCGLNLGYRRSQRPPIGVGLCLAVSIIAPAFAGLYNTLSPLGKDYETEIDPEAQGEVVPTADAKPATARVKSLEKKFSFVTREDQREVRPEWVGGLFDIWDDISLAYLSVFCSCCVFGWNMQRLGFGNMYVHIVTFLLFCLAPFFIFNLAAINIDNETVREALGYTGIVLCVFGLLYGGFWRIQMRNKFNLPGSKFCCGKASVTDCCQWLFCCSCSLAQEVRTADFYDIVEDKLCIRQMEESNRGALSPLPREEGSPLFRSTPGSPYTGKSSPIFKVEYKLTPGRVSGSQTPDRLVPHKEDAMSPPVPNVAQREDRPTQ